MLASAVRTSIYLEGLGIAVLFFALRPDVAQFPPIIADIVILIFKDLIRHVIILPDIFPVSTGFPFLMLLELDIRGNLILFQIQQIFLAAVTAVSGYFFQHFVKSFFMFLQNRDISSVITHVTMEDEIVLHHDIDIVCRFQLAIQHVFFLHPHKSRFQVHPGITVTLFLHDLKAFLIFHQAPAAFFHLFIKLLDFRFMFPPP